MKFPFLVLLFPLVQMILAANAAQAGQVILSCDLGGYVGIDDIQVKKTPRGLQVDVFAGEAFRYYSLPVSRDQSVDTQVDLSGFNVFNDLDQPRLVKMAGSWSFVATGMSHGVDCASLK